MVFKTIIYSFRILFFSAFLSWLFLTFAVKVGDMDVAFNRIQSTSRGEKRRFSHPNHISESLTSSKGNFN